ncbi:hypothetical protein [Xanthobacter pseudotagetidis]|uniref:hypothetical protein n=1 Tax=Xanthobacter pseudotagetidis TaxID=3119911 RepID=UPI0037297EEA
MSVIEHDFGAEKRRKERRFRTLLSLDALHEQNVRANPLPYLERASERIFQLERALFEAALAGRPDAGAPGPEPGTLVVEAGEYARLRACHAAVEQALAALCSDAEEDGAP